MGLQTVIPEVHVRSQLLAELEKAGPHFPGGPSLILLSLNDENEEVRIQAAKILLEFFPEQLKERSDLIDKVVEESSPKNRLHHLTQLGNILPVGLVLPSAEGKMKHKDVILLDSEPRIESENSTHAQEFEQTYPETLGQRLRFYAQKLDIPNKRLLTLMDLPIEALDAEVNEHGWEFLENDAEMKNQAWWLEGVLCQLAALFGYDFARLKQHLHNTRTHRNTDGQAWESPWSDDELRAQIKVGGPSIYQALGEYLSRST